MKLFGNLIIGIFMMLGLGNAVASETTDSSIAQKKLALQFAQEFTKKDANAIGKLLDDNFVLYEPGRTTNGKQKVIDMFAEQFQNTKDVSYKVAHAYQDGNTSILEFRITVNEQHYYGVDIIEWRGNKMSELRCYYNELSKPLSK